MQVGPGATIDALSSAIADLLAPVSDALAPQVAILPTQTNPVGIGGFIGYSKSPPAELMARRLEGEVVVRIFADSAAELLEAEARVARDLVAASPDLLRRRGISRLRRVLDSPDRRLEAADGIAAPFGQDLRFAVKFEHMPLPTDSEGEIKSVPQDIAVAGPARKGRLRYSNEFLADPLADFTPIAGAGSGTAPVWTYIPANPDASAGQQVRQTGTLKGGQDGVSGDKTGAYLILNNSAAGGELADFVLHADVWSDDPASVGDGVGLGLVFRFRDPGDFGFFIMEQGSPGRRLFGRRADDAGHLLAEGGQDLTQGLPTGTWLRLRLLAEGDRFELAVNEVVALTGKDTNLGQPGSVGLFCRGNPNARFRHIRLTEL